MKKSENVHRATLQRIKLFEKNQRALMKNQNTKTVQMKKLLTQIQEEFAKFNKSENRLETEPEAS